MKAIVNWQSGLSFSGTADSGSSVKLDADLSVGGHGDGFRPLELMALSLAGCTAMDVISILQKKRQDIIGFEVRLQAERAQEHPKVITSAIIEYHLTGHSVDEKAVLRAIELSAERYCPAQSMLGKIMPIELHYVINEESDGDIRQVASGGYKRSE